jgi:uncharacterized protein
MRVSALFRYPVKSLQGEPLQSADVGMHGIVGDRHWGIVDVETGLVLTARREPPLLMARARLLQPPIPDAELPAEVEIVLPDGTVTTDAEVLSDWLDRRVELRRCDDDAEGTYEISLGIDDELASPWVQWTGPRGSFHDSTKAKLSLIAQGSMRNWAWRRFRGNVIVSGDDGDDDKLVGRRVGIGSATLDVAAQIERCVMTTRPQPSAQRSPAIERDLSVLKTINAERGKFMGVGMLVAAAGTISVGDVVNLDPAAAP